MAVSTQLICLERVHEKICSKEYCLVEQSLYELEAEEAKMGSNPTMVETAHMGVVKSLFPAVHPLLLADLFEFGSSFSLLPDLLSYNTL